MKKLFLITITIALALTMSGCFLWHSGTPEGLQIPAGMYRLVADFSNGTLEGELKFSDVPIESAYYDSDKQEHVYTSAAYVAAAMELSGYLSEWTGLDFTLNKVTVLDGGLLVDWSKSSTLVAGLDSREQKEDFRFSDAVSLNWFMMDTLKHTLLTNIQMSTVHYVCESEPLTFPNPEDMAAQGLTELPVDEPYYGSYYYVSRSSEMSDPHEASN